MLEVKNLKNIVARQKEIISSLESEIATIEKSDILIENEKINKELANYKELFSKEKAENVRLSEENKNLKNAVYEQLYNEKLHILNSTNRKLDVYFSSNIEGEINRLKNYETTVKSRIDDMTRLLEANKIALHDEIYVHIAELRKLLDERLRQAREEILKNTDTFKETRNAEFQKLKQEQLSEEEIKGRVKQNNVEAFIGLNIINKIGILLLIIGVITAAQFTYLKLPDILKCIFTFAIGITMVLAGELLNKKKPNVFSLGITSGGIAILYVALVLSYFQFKLLDMFPALGLCILITAAALILSQRYASQTISIFAIIGGYLPILSVTGNNTMVYSAMVYFIVLNVLVLIISVNRRWIVTSYIGFWLNVTGSFYIMSMVLEGRENRLFSTEDLITILYIVLAFITYTLIPIVGIYRKKLSFRNSEIVLLAFNTVISSLLLYLVFYSMKLDDYTGLLAIVFALVYIGMGRFVESFMNNERKARALFYITGLTFVVLVIPFQFDKMWFSLGWLIEGVALLSYGILKEIKSFKRAGIVISFICLGAFVMVDILFYDSTIFIYKYMSITTGSLIILGSLIYKNHFALKSTKLYKYFTIVNLWLFSLYVIGNQLSQYFSRVLLQSELNSDYLICSAMILVSFIFAYFLPRIKVITDTVIRLISSILYIIGVLSLFMLNFFSPVKGYPFDVPVSISLAATLELLIISLLSVLAVRDFVINVVTDRRKGIEWFPLIVSAYCVVILTQNLITQFNLEFNNALISIIYLVTSLGWITFGFIRRYVFIRRYGLGLCILSVAKLFLIDLSFLTQGYRIISYFIFGLMLVAISFVYQYFSKKIEVEVLTDEKNSDN